LTVKSSAGAGLSGANPKSSSAAPFVIDEDIVSRRSSNCSLISRADSQASSYYVGGAKKEESESPVKDSGKFGSKNKITNNTKRKSLLAYKIPV
jgi:hypothetical protein